MCSPSPNSQPVVGLLLPSNSQRFVYWLHVLPEILYNFNGIVPELMKMVLGEHVHVQTVCILDTFKGFFENWTEKAGVAFEEDVLRITKTKGFVKFDKPKFQDTYMAWNNDLIELNTNA